MWAILDFDSLRDATFNNYKLFKEKCVENGFVWENFIKIEFWVSGLYTLIATFWGLKLPIFYFLYKKGLLKKFWNFLKNRKP